MAKYEYVDSQKHEPGNMNPVSKMCLWLEVSKSGFYHWLGRPQSATAARRQALTARFQHFFDVSEGTYGYRRIHVDLAEEDTECSPELVRQIMRREGLIACQPRPFRVTTENTNGLLRQYFPKGTDLSRWSAEDLEAVALALNNRPRKSLDWKTPAEVFDEQIRSLKQSGVATTS